jgi:hypothetical protein
MDLKWVHFVYNSDLAEGDIFKEMQIEYGKHLISTSDVEPDDPLYDSYMTGDYIMSNQMSIDPIFVKIARRMMKTKFSPVIITLIPELLLDHIKWDLDDNNQSCTWGGCEMSISIESYIQAEVTKLDLADPDLKRRVQFLKEIIILNPQPRNEICGLPPIP